MRAYNIVILPPQEITERAIAVSRVAKKHGGVFALNTKNIFPHITLQQTMFDPKDIPRIKKILKQFAQETTPFRASVTRYRTSHDHFVHVAYRHTSFLRIQKEILRALNIPNQQQGYVPHITFSYFHTLPKNIVRSLPVLSFSFDADTIALFELGEYGTCVKEIARYTLGK